MIGWLQLRADAEFGADTMPHPMDFIVSQVENGVTITELAADISSDTGYDVTRAALDRYIREQPKGRERIEAARQLGGWAMVERGIVIVDGAEEDRDAIRKAQLQSNYRLQVASKMNRAELGDSGSRGLNVNLNFGDLHLAAHKALRAPVEAEVISDAEVELIEAPAASGAQGEGVEGGS